MELETCRKCIADANTIVIFIGAGLSAASGIPTFRDPEIGVWKNKIGLALFGTPIGWKIMPRLAWRAFLRFLEPIQRATPNPSHHALSQLYQRHQNTFFLSQNVDELLQQAGVPDTAIFMLHGSTSRYRCTRCSQPITIPDIMNPQRCECGGYPRPDAVLFGEELTCIEPAWKKVAQLQRGDIFMSVGTSLQVHPAAELANLAIGKSGICSIEINPDRTSFSQHATFSFRSRAEDILPRLISD